MLAATFCVLMFFTVQVRGESKESSAPAADEDLLSEFQDKIVMIEVNRSSAMETKSTTVVVQNAHINKIGGRYFVHGTAYVTEDSDYQWYKDVIVGVPWDNIVRYQAFTTEQYTEYLKQWKEHSKD
jgi:hypothetical protein